MQDNRFTDTLDGTNIMLAIAAENEMPDVTLNLNLGVSFHTTTAAGVTQWCAAFGKYPLTTVGVNPQVGRINAGINNGFCATLLISGYS
jgi:hypothetical protein